MNALTEYLIERQNQSVFREDFKMYYEVKINRGAYIETYRFWGDDSGWYYENETHYCARSLTAQEIHRLAR